MPPRKFALQMVHSASISKDHELIELRAEILPIFSNVVYSSPATYFILVINSECDVYVFV